MAVFHHIYFEKKIQENINMKIILIYIHFYFYKICIYVFRTIDHNFLTNYRKVIIITVNLNYTSPILLLFKNYNTIVQEKVAQIGLPTVCQLGKTILCQYFDGLGKQSSELQLKMKCIKIQACFLVTRIHEYMILPFMSFNLYTRIHYPAPNVLKLMIISFTLHMHAALSR